ncbi:CMP-N-acetylneuraminate-beta-galactosamide-alpha-2,3-sialyltransferase 4-like isoform X2 [Aquarana catesbeiana]|uniref:CMP-N-acetylneuraminate-beta-galactosamide- alpha-2,3-sialyltransferase 4-like isoform X2 n=1 Tax=Aquarana catesbeiana TaxID=8400 RepID=UPI003CC9BC89
MMRIYNCLQHLHPNILHLRRITTLCMNMAQGRKVRAVFATVLCCATLYYMNYEKSQLRSYQHILGTCTPGDVASRASAVISNYSKDHPVFLQLSDYFWVKKTSRFSLPYGTMGSEKKIMQVLAAANHYHIPQEIVRLQCKRCIVVGSGYRMKNSSLGYNINKYDIVIRMNDAPVHNYEEDVGSKTTLRFFYPESAFSDPKLDNNPDTLMLKQGFWRQPPIIWNVKPQNIRILNPYFMEFAAEKLLEYNETTKTLKATPTTGFMAITFAIHFCDLVHVAGFGYPNFNDTEPIHYYDNSSMEMLTVTEHNISLEAIAIKELLQHNIIQNLTYF